jgi:branched-chain amino acid transport system permease protein
LDFGPFLFLATLEGLLQASILALTALGLSLVFGVMRIVNVAHGEFFMLGAVLAWFVASLLPLHPALAFLLALIISPLATALLAYACERVFLSRLNNSPEATIVATIGLLYMLQQGALMSFGPDARPVDGPFYFRVEFPWFGYSGYNLCVIAAVAVILSLVWYVLSRTRIGLVMRATQYDRETAQAFGIPVKRVYAMVFAVGAGLAALAAVLIVPIRQAHYLMGQDALLLSFIVVIIGGLGSLTGTVVAALMIGLGDGIISVFFSPTLAKMISTLLVAMVLIFKPEGLFGAKAR